MTVSEKRISNSVISLIGSGNLATAIGSQLYKKGFTVAEVYSRKLSHAEALAKKLKCSASDNIKNISKKSDIYLVAVSDDAVADVATQLNVSDKLIIHTSGSTGLQALMKPGNSYGVLYPVQTFTKGRQVNWKKVPLCIEANDKRSLELLRQFAGALSQNVYEIDSAERRVVHLSAVFACNFTNHLYAIAEKMLAEHNLTFDLLRPLIKETTKKALSSSSPAAVQTGPARRNDHTVIQKHMELLKEDKKLQEIYQIITESIQMNDLK